MTPDETVFRAHLEAGPFQSGVERGRWHLVQVEWPYAVMVVTAAPREGAPSDYAFRFDCRHYPHAAPTAQPWDVALNQPLAHDEWPTGKTRLPLACNPGWKGGQCLYLPCDRLSMEGHDAWRTQHPSLLWSESGDITQYLKVIYDLLHSGDYTGTRRAASHH